MGDTTAISAASARGYEELDAVARASLERPVWVRVGQLIDGVSNAPLRDADVVFNAREIKFVGSNPPRDVLGDGPGASAGAPDAVLPDCTVLPCLIEAHAHLFLGGATIDFKQREQYLKQPADALLAQARARWDGILRHGIGAVRDAGDRHGVGLALAAEARGDLGQLPRTPFIDSPGAALHHRGRYGAFMGQAVEDYPTLDDCVAARVAAGADRIKLLVSGIINFQEGKVTTPPQLTVDEVRAIVAAAARHGRQTFAHASGSDGVENAIEGGVTTVEHGFFVTPEQLGKMRDRGIGWVPTFAPVQLQIDRAAELGWSETVVGHLRRIIDGHRDMLRKAGEMGVTILAGSDAGSCGVPHGLGLLREMAQMEQAGLSPMAVIRSATGASAGMLGFAEPIGRIAPGCRTRLIVTRHDPLETVANLQKPMTVLFDGRAIAGGGDGDVAGL